MNIAAVVGTILALAALCLTIVEVSLQSFVEVFIALGDGDDAPLSCKIAGLGVYYTSYDSSCLTDQQLADSRVPAEKFTSPTTKFKLLFPAQDNFVAEVIPVNDELIDQFGGTADFLKPLVKNVADTKFKSCTQYMDEIHANMDALFAALYQVLPLFGTFLFTETATSLNDAILAVENGSAYAAGLGGTFVAASILFPATACAELDGLAFFAAMTNVTLPCIQSAYSLGGLVFGSNPSSVAGPLLTDLAAYFGSHCLDDGTQTPKQCLDLLGVSGATVETTPIITPGGLAGNDLCAAATSLCNTATSTKIDLMGAVVQAGIELTSTGLDLSTLPDPVQAIVAGATLGITAVGSFALLIEVMGSRFVELFARPNFSDKDVKDFLSNLQGVPGTIYSFPAAFNDTYDPCAFLLFLEAGIQQNQSSFVLESLAAVNATVTDCPFSVWWSGATEIAAAGGASSDQISLFGAIGDLTETCQQFSASNPAFNPQTCDKVFASIFMSLTYTSEFPITSLAEDPSGDKVFSLAVNSCEDDATDKKKITQAQILAGVAIGMAFLTFLSGILSLIVSKAQLMLILGGLLSFVSLALNTAALLTVRSAPVYQSVGDPAVKDEPVYKDGIDVVVALVAIILSAVTGVALLLGAAAQMKGWCGVSKAESEAKEIVVPAEKEDPDAKPTV